MLFEKLCEYIDELKNTRSRLNMVEIISKCLNELKDEADEELSSSLYFLYGKIDSEIKMENNKNLGVAEKQLISIISEKTGVNTNDVTKVVKKYGDVGIAAEKIMSSSNKNSIKLDKFFNNVSLSTNKKSSVFNILSEIHTISKLSGKNSNKDKNTKIVNLISNLNPKSVKYLFNIITGTLRTGASIKTIIEALSVTYLNSKDYKSEVEKAYYLNPDIGKIGIICKNDGLNGIKNVKINIGTPIKMMLASRLNVGEIINKIGSPFLSEYKYDGERVQVHKKGDKITLFSRHMKDITIMYPDIIENIHKNVMINDIIFEGEIVAMDEEYSKMLPFQVVSKRRRKHNIEEYSQSIIVTLFVFDILYIDGENVMDKELSIRRKILEEVIKHGESIRLSTGKFINTESEMIDFFNNARKDGAEGIMNKSLSSSSVYSPGNRGFLWVKLKGIKGSKMLDTIDTVIIGASYGKGKRSDMLSSFLVAIFNQSDEKFETFTKVGSGFTEETLIELTERLQNIKINTDDSFSEYSIHEKEYDVDFYVKPEVIIEIMGDEFTKSQIYKAGSSLYDHGLSIRFPIFKSFRNDKDITDITTTDEIIEMYNSQNV